MTLLSLQDVSVGYGEKAIVRNASFDLAEGEVCALLGLNGSGKTTLLKAICGLLPMQGGRCLVNGQDCTRLHEHKRARQISYIPQRYSELAGVTVLDAVLMGLNAKLGLLEFPSTSDREMALNTLEKMGAGNLAGEDFSRLSEGQKQLVVLSRTLLQNVPVMLMDEPDSALDFQARHRILGKIRRLIHSEDKAALVTLHDPNLALNYCDRLILLQGGEIAADISLVDTSKAAIQATLAAVYNNIVILEHSDKFIALYGE